MLAAAPLPTPGCPLALCAVVGVVACVGAMRGIINNSINYSLFADI